MAKRLSPENVNIHQHQQSFDINRVSVDQIERERENKRGGWDYGLSLVNILLIVDAVIRILKVTHEVMLIFLFSILNCNQAFPMPLKYLIQTCSNYILLLATCRKSCRIDPITFASEITGEICPVVFD